MKTIKRVKLKSGGYGTWDYNYLANLPDIPKVSSDKIDELIVSFDEESSSLTVKNPGGNLNTELDLSRLIRTGELDSVELSGKDAVGTEGMYLKFTWRTGNNTNVTYANIGDFYKGGNGITITKAQDGNGKIISIDTSYIEELTTQLIQDQISNAIQESKERWLEL